MATMTHEEVEEKMLDMLEEVCGDEEVRDHRAWLPRFYGGG